MTLPDDLYIRNQIINALLDAMEFISERLQETQQESYELVGFDDAIMNILEFFNYKITHLTTDNEEFALFRNSELQRYFKTQHDAWFFALKQLRDLGDI